MFINIGNCPSLAHRGLAAYARLEPAIARRVKFSYLDYNVRDALQGSALHAEFTPASMLDEMLSDARAHEPDVIGLNVYIWNVDLVYNLVERLHAMMPAARIVLGGRQTDHTTQDVLARLPYVTIVRGEAEGAFRNLLLAWLDEPAPTVIGSISYVENGKQVHTPQGGYLESLDEIPFAYDDCLDEIASLVDRFPGWPRVQYESTRGCPYKCSFCLYGKLPKVSYRSPDSVIPELTRLLERDLTVEIVDPVFALHKKRTKEILRGLAGKVSTGLMTVETYAELLDEEMVELMAASGVGHVGVGLQSVDPQALETMVRNFNEEKYRRSIELMQRYDLEFYVDLIYGLPDSDYEAFKRSVDFVYSMGVSRIQMYRLLMLPGSEMTTGASEHEMRWNAQAPYELLANTTWPLEHVLTAQRFATTYQLLQRRLAATGLMDRMLEFTTSPAGLIERIAERLHTCGFNFLAPARGAKIDPLEVFCAEAGIRIAPQQSPAAQASRAG